jgi:uncharacterized membrane protein
LLAAASDGLAAKLPLAVPKTLKIRQAVAKTITFRIIATTLDFTTNYLVIGELAAAAGLSSFALVFGPLFYLTHEAAWNHFGPSGTAAEDPNPRSLGPDVKVTLAGRKITVGRALAKTITFRAVVTVTDFTANYVVVVKVGSECDRSRGAAVTSSPSAEQRREPAAGASSLLASAAGDSSYPLYSHRQPGCAAKAGPLTPP